MDQDLHHRHRKVRARVKKLFLIAAFLPINAFSATYTSQPSIVAPSGYFIIYDVQGTLSFEPSTHWELPKNITDMGNVLGKSCAYALSIPISLALNATKVSGAYGENGYNKAVKNILKTRPDISGIYDVKVDTHIITVLGIFTRQCLLLSAHAFKISNQNTRQKT